MVKGIDWKGGKWRFRHQTDGVKYTTVVEGTNTTPGLKKAEKQYRLWLADIRAGCVNADAPLFSEVAQEFLNLFDGKKSTRSGYVQDLNRYWNPVFNSTPISEIKPPDIRKILASMDVSNKRKLNAMGPLRGVMNLALEHEYIEVNPCNPIKIKRQDRAPIERFSAAEINKIWARLDDKHWLYFTLFLDCGLRTGELLGLEWEHLQGEDLYICQSMTRRTITTTKTYRRRHVRLSNRLKKAMHENPGRFKGGFVFKNEDDDHHKDADRFNSYWKSLLESAKVPYRIPYTLRHTRASNMLMAGVKPAYASKQLGHTQEQFFRTYADWIYSDEDAIQARILDSISG